MEQIQKGDFVRIKGQESVGEVITVKGSDLEVLFGLVKVTVKKNKVELAEPQEEYETGQSPSSGIIDTKEKLLHFKFELDVRGKMKEEVMNDLNVWVDDAVLLGIKEARIIHGRGTGILKETVRSLLKKYKEIDSLSDEEQGKGGDAVTVVKFKA